MAKMLETALRPREIVERFMEQEINRLRGDKRRRLPTITELASHLKVSPATVRAVYGDLASEGRIVSTPGKGTFVAGDPRSGGGMGSVMLLINASTTTATASDVPPGSWGTGITLGAVEEASNRHFLLTALPMDKGGANGLIRACKDALEMASGLILFPSHTETSLLSEAASRRNLPVVHINPPAANATANFVCNDAFPWCMRIAEIWRATGRKRLLVAMNSAPTPEVSVSYTIMLNGLYCGWKSYENDSRFDVVVIGNGEGDKLQAWLDHCGDNPPDAVFASNPYVADQILRWCVKRGVNVPEACSLVVDSDDQELRIGDRLLTTMGQRIVEIGRESVRIMAQLLDTRAEALPGVFLPPVTIRGDTTTAEENALLDSAPQGR